MKVFIDIETIPNQPEDGAKAEIAKTIEAPATMKKAETIADWHNGAGKYEGVKDAAIEKAYRDTSFDGAKGEVVSIAWAVENNEVKYMVRDYLKPKSEYDLLSTALVAIRGEMTSFGAETARPPFFIGHRVAGFDLKFLFHRSVILGVGRSFRLPFYGRHDQDYFDTMIGWCGYKDSISQDNLCKALGIEGKPDDIDGSKVWDFIKAGDYERVGSYNADDVEKNRQIFKRMSNLNP